MSAFSAAASDEDCDEITRLRDENRRLISTLNRVAEVRSQLVAQRDELLEALRITAQALAWLHWGECRGFHDGLEQPNDALSIARMAIEKATGE